MLKGFCEFLKLQLTRYYLNNFETKHNNNSLINKHFIVSKSTKTEQKEFFKHLFLLQKFLITKNYLEILFILSNRKDHTIHFLFLRNFVSQEIQLSFSDFYSNLFL
jgi:hypothetical protein